MTCITFGNAIVCGFHPTKRFHIGNKYVWMEFHRYCGPMFWTDSNLSKEYQWKDENDIKNDPIWEHFDKWFQNYKVVI